MAFVHASIGHGFNQGRDPLAPSRGLVTSANMLSQRMIDLFLVGTGHIAGGGIQAPVIVVHIRKRNAGASLLTHADAPLGVGVNQGGPGRHHADLTVLVRQDNVLGGLSKMLEGPKGILNRAGAFQVMKGGPFVTGLFANPAQGQQIPGGRIGRAKPSTIIFFEHRFVLAADLHLNLKGVQRLPNPVQEVIPFAVGLEKVKIGQIPGGIGHAPGHMAVEATYHKGRPSDAKAPAPGSVIGTGGRWGDFFVDFVPGRGEGQLEVGVVAEVIAAVAGFAAGDGPVIGAQAVIVRGFDPGIGVAVSRSLNRRDGAEGSRLAVIKNPGGSFHQDFSIQTGDLQEPL